MPAKHKQLKMTLANDAEERIVERRAAEMKLSVSNYLSVREGFEPLQRGGLREGAFGKAAKNGRKRSAKKR